jgi:hypothetical protein
MAKQVSPTHPSSTRMQFAGALWALLRTIGHVAIPPSQRSVLVKC